MMTSVDGSLNETKSGRWEPKLVVVGHVVQKSPNTIVQRKIARADFKTVV